MHHKTQQIILVIASFVLIQSCQTPVKDTENQPTGLSQKIIVKSYNGKLYNADYDSIVNQLTLYNNETFSLRQVDRIGEHHLHDRNHTGIYVFLRDSTQLALYSEDGVLMLRFLLKNDNLLPMNVGGDAIPDTGNIWILKNVSED